MLANENINELASEIFEERKNIIPIIGENSFFYYSENGDKIPLQHFLIDKLIEISGKIPDSRLIEQMREKGYYGLSLCRQKCFSQDKKFVKEYNSIIRKYKESIHLDEPIKEFLLNYKFRLIITTCCFDFIESDLSIYDSKVYIAANGANNKEPLDNNDYIVYHIFGKSDNTSMKWAWNEESLIDILHCHHNGDIASTSLRQYIFPDQEHNAERKSLLVLYSNLPDWLFRFFLYPLANNKETWSEKGYYLNSASKTECSLKNFIDNVICYEIEENEISEVLTIANRLRQQEEFETLDPNGRIQHGMEYDIFISYSSDDKEIALEIADKLRKLYGLNIWIDESVIKDGHYPHKIKNGIENSAYFMPLITSSYKEKLSNKKYSLAMPLEEILSDTGDSYVQKEAWAAAKHREISKQQRRSYLLPIIFPESGLSYNNIQAMQQLGQLPENLFKEQSIIKYNDNFFEERDWAIYKTIENN